jgi:hypothetical protein
MHSLGFTVRLSIWISEMPIKSIPKPLESYGFPASQNQQESFNNLGEKQLIGLAAIITERLAHNLGSQKVDLYAEMVLEIHLQPNLGLVALLKAVADRLESVY